MIDQKKLSEYLTIVEEKKIEIERAKKGSYFTNLMYPFTKTEHISLASITKVEDLVDILSNLISKQTSYEKAVEILQIKGVFKIGVSSLYTFEEWVEDLKTRASILNLRKNKEILLKLEAELLNLESEEVKQQKKFNALEDILKNL